LRPSDPGLILGNSAGSRFSPGMLEWSKCKNVSNVGSQRKVMNNVNKQIFVHRFKFELVGAGDMAIKI
jgi:hypothetical protein